MDGWPKIPLEDEFGDILHKGLRGLGISEKQLAAETGVPESLLHRWRGHPPEAYAEANPTEEQVHAIARALRMNPQKLADRAFQRWYPREIDVPEVRHHAQQPHPSNGYVFFLDGGKRAALIDPAGIPANLLRTLHDSNYHLQYILITHKHADHCDAAADVAAAFPSAKIVMHEKDVHAIGALASKAHLVRDGEALAFGNSSHIQLFHTPGHTDGSTCFLFTSRNARNAPTVFTGDMLFAGSVGGAYGDKSTYNDILASIRSQLFTLPDETLVMPGHGPPSTIAEEQQHNPFF